MHRRDLPHPATPDALYVSLAYILYKGGGRVATRVPKPRPIPRSSLPYPQKPLVVCVFSFSFLGHVADNDAQDPAVDEEEAQRGEPQARDEGAAAQELEPEALLQPGALGRDPEGQGGAGEGRAAQQGGAREVERQEDHVPEEVLPAPPVSQSVSQRGCFLLLKEREEMEREEREEEEEEGRAERRSPGSCTPC